MSKHTPGPWQVPFYDRVDGGGEQIAILNKGNPNCVADARLIAAAPAMLEYLKTCLAISGGRTSFGKYLPKGIEELIAKAEGKR
ncbi:MAG: hypothetical protein ACXWQO_07960 [Bdellovibrionota bacterium]